MSSWIEYRGWPEVEIPWLVQNEAQKLEALFRSGEGENYQFVLIVEPSTEEGVAANFTLQELESEAS